MLLTRRRTFVKRISFATLQICMLIFLIVFVLFPIIFRYSISLQKALLFSTFVKFPNDFDLANPARAGLYGTRKFDVNVMDSDVEDKKNGVSIGVWHVLPHYIAKRFSKELHIEEKSLAEDSQKSSNVTLDDDEQLNKMEPILKSEFPTVNAENEQLFFERMLKLRGTIILYLHGNTGTRGSGPRVEMYRVLRRLGYHVLTFDYRGFGDSDPVSPTEEGLVRDAMAVYQYISNLTSNPVIVWGHSLGTGVSTNLCSQLNYMNERGPRGVILEAPFTNIRDEIQQHPLSRPFKNLPWFDLTIARPMYSNSLRFESDIHISEFRQPVMIIHAEDDCVVPFHLGYKLYRTALDTRGKSWGPVEFHRFDGSHDFGHKFLCRAPQLPELIKQFVTNYRNEVF